MYINQDTSANLLASGWTTEVRMPGGKGKVLFATLSRTALDPIQPLIKLPRDKSGWSMKQRTAFHVEVR
jgi:hypothetical protein